MWYQSAQEFWFNRKLRTKDWESRPAVAGAPCEWLLRRHPLRLRFSLRTLLGAVGLSTVFFAWCTALRRRADEQDAFMAELRDKEGSMQFDFERWGPQWLGHVIDDRIRRRIVGASVWEPDAEILKRLTRMPGLRSLVLSRVGSAKARTFAERKATLHGFSDRL